MKSGFFFRSKKGVAITFVILAVLISTLWAVLAPVWMSVGRSNPINGVTHALLDDSAFKTTASNYFISKLKEDASGEQLLLLNGRKSQLEAAATQLLSNPEFKTKVDEVTTQVYDYYILGSDAAKSISVAPIAALALDTFTSVNPKFAKLQKEIDKIKPIELKPTNDGPNLRQINGLLNLAFLLTSLLLLILIFSYAIFARNRSGFLLTLGSIFIYIAILDFALKIIGNFVSTNQIKTMDDELAQAAVPIIFAQLSSPLIVFAALFSILGVAGVAFGLLTSKKATLQPR